MSQVKRIDEKIEVPDSEFDDSDTESRILQQVPMNERVSNKEHRATTKMISFYIDLVFPFQSSNNYDEAATSQQ